MIFFCCHFVDIWACWVLLRFHSIIKWLPVIHIWHEMSNHKSFYLSQANCSKIILLLQTTEEKGKKRFSQTRRYSRDQPELSVVLLCIITLGLLLNTVYLCDSALAGECRNIFQFGILSFLRSIDFTETTVHMSLDNPPFKVKNCKVKKCLLLLRPQRHSSYSK